MLQMISRFEFQKDVNKTQTEYHARGFRSWNHFVSMLFGQLSAQDSLRGIEAGLASQAHSIYHLGVRPVHRSTLSYANAHRSHELFNCLRMDAVQMSASCSKALVPIQKPALQYRRNDY